MNEFALAGAVLALIDERDTLRGQLANVRNALREAAAVELKSNGIRCSFDDCDCVGPYECKERPTLTLTEIIRRIDDLTKEPTP